MTLHLPRPLPLALALSLVFGTGALQAQSAPNTDTNAAAAREIRIAAQPLGDALNAWARQTQMQMAVQHALVAGKTAPAVAGQLTPRQALDRLLQGSGLVANVQGSTVSIRRAPEPGQDASLAAVTVTAQGPQDGTTEGSGSYTTQQMSTATGLPMSIRETPQSVSVVTRARMADSAVTSVQDALEYTTGMVVSAVRGESYEFLSRGSRAHNLLIDGTAIAYDADSMGSDTLAIYDRIEVVRGSTGLMEGAGGPSASINLVRKRPTREFQGEVSASVGSWSNRSATLDLGGPLNEAKTLRARTVVTADQGDTFTSGYSRKGQLVYGIVEADIAKDTILTLGGYYNNRKSPGADYNGVPTRADGSLYDFDRSVRANPVWSHWDKIHTNLFGEVKSHLGNGWEVAFKGSYLESKLDILGTGMWARDAADTLVFEGKKFNNRSEQTSFDLGAHGPVTLFGREHQLALGMDYRRRHDDYTGGNSVGYASRFDPANWEASVQAPLPTKWSQDANNGYIQDLKVAQYGAYGTAKINITEPLKVIVGGRLSWYQSDEYLRSGSWQSTTSLKEKAEFTPYVAVTYDLDKNYTVYGSVTSIFLPQNYAATGGGLLDPIKGTNYEAGVKGEFFDGRLNASAAVFQINQTNLPVLLDRSACVSTSVNCYGAAGEVRSRGTELEISGNLSSHWKAFAGYAFVRSEYAQDSTAGKAGTPYGTTMPRHVFTLSTMYSFPGELAGWRVGASARVQSDISNIRAGFANVAQPGYGIANLVVGWRVNKDLDLQLNVNNLFDKYYYRAVASPVHGNLFGNPRNAQLTARYQF
ncbi:MAG: TonB-dependent siderophore receptor [Comamonas sp.]